MISTPKLIIYIQIVLYIHTHTYRHSGVTGRLLMTSSNLWTILGDLGFLLVNHLRLGVACRDLLTNEKLSSFCTSSANRLLSLQSKSFGRINAFQKRLGSCSFPFKVLHLQMRELYLSRCPSFFFFTKEREMS